MKSSSFLSFVRESYRVDGRTLIVFIRALKEAGLITSGGRGRHAPHMQPIDAARITIALLATDKPARAVDRLERFGNLVYQPSQSTGPFPAALGIEMGATLEEVLVNLFSSNLDTDDVYRHAPYVEIQENARRAVIEFASDDQKYVAVFKDANRTEEQKSQDRGEFFGIRQARGLSSAELMQLHVPFYCERRDGRSWEEIVHKLTVGANDDALRDPPIEVSALIEPSIERRDEPNG